MALMPRALVLHPDRLLPADPGVRAVARSLYAHVRELPIISPHGHTDPAWFAYNQPFGDAVDLLLAPDHYLYRMLHSQGVPLDQLGVRSRRGAPVFDPREAWRVFASHYALFRGTPSALWLDQVFADVFGLKDNTVGFNDDTRDADGWNATFNLDASLQYNVTSHFRVTLEGVNLTDQYESEFDDTSRKLVYYYHHTGRQVLLGARYQY